MATYMQFTKEHIVVSVSVLTHAALCSSVHELSGTPAAVERILTGVHASHRMQWTCKLGALQ
jgi:hypothetical protein